MPPELTNIVLLIGALTIIIIQGVFQLYFWRKQEHFSLQVHAILEVAGLEKTGRGRYHAKFNGRDFNVYLFPGRNTRYERSGPSLEIHLPGAFNAQVVVALPKILVYSQLRNWLPPLIRETPFQITLPGYAGYAVYTADRVSASSLLTLPVARQAIVAVLDNFGIQRVALSIFPGILRFVVREFDPQALSPELIQRWLAGLDEIATLAQSLSPLQPGALDEGLQVARRQNQPKFLVLALLLSILLPLLVILFTLLQSR